jgi:CarboxypepD_reg-like domain
MNNSRNFIFILLFIVNGINAQIVLRGYVKDSIGEPLEFVNIFTQENDSSSIIAFGTSDDKGYFSFETPTLSQFVIKASALGYATKAIDIRNNNKTVLEVNFILSSKEYILKETVVRGSNKVLLRSDTITFNADKYRDSTERNLEELLAKIPGLDVDKNTGVISVQGQPIKKILIDGDDLTGRNYQLMSQNMSADVVDKIQVIDKFTENKLLKGLKRSDDKVINITLKEGRKKLLFGNALVAVSNDERTNNSFNLFGFFNKLKTISFGNFNTIGQLSTADRLIDTDFKEDTESENQRSLLKSHNTSLIDIGRTPSVSLNSQSVRFNRAVFGSTHFTIRPTESLSLKGAFTFTQDRVRSFINNEFNSIVRAIFNKKNTLDSLMVKK